MLSDKAASALDDIGVKVKEKDIMGKFIVGKSKFVFEPVFEDGTPVPIEKIGNGTKVYALVSSYRHKMSAKFGAAPSIRKIVVTELVEYDNNDDGVDVESMEEEDIPF
jgi:hypothetical protein